ncbi:MAG TPA: hypothetical protein VMV03_01780 [Spirochaetia bacterium]|nr:hypothetical protein [Spirochaetia bacterium]
MKHPALGIVSSILVIAVSLGFIAVFPVPVFLGWVSSLLVCLIPTVIVIVWIASALLAVTFPFLIIFADLLQFWPLASASSRERP